MNKALMIPIQPQHARNILNGYKTLELRTWIPKGYVGWVYVYVTKGKPYLINTTSYQWLNGEVAFRFWFDEYDTLKYIDGYYEVNPHDIPLNLCLDIKQINGYGKGKDLYAWHIKQLEIFDEPKQLSYFHVERFKKIQLNSLVDLQYSDYEPLKKAPQRSVWVYV